jgi:hypothetical protein
MSTALTPTTPPAATPGVSGAVPSRSRRMHEVDWTMAHGAILAPVNAGGAVLCAAMLGKLWHATPRVALAAGVILGVGAAVRALARGRTRVGAAFRVACWGAGGWWVSWTWATTPWQGDALALLAAATVAFGLAAQHIISEHEDDAAQRKEEVRTARERAEVATDWEARIKRVAQIDVDNKITSIETWPDSSGMTMLIELPEGGSSWKTLRDVADQLAADADLPGGCQVEVSPGATRRQAVLRIQVLDRMGVDLPYPDDVSTLSVNGPLPVGIRASGEVRTVSILEDPLLCVARRGSGKTVFLHTLTADLARCPDVVKWQIDLNGAGFSAPWLRPWREGKVRRPVVDWVAATPAEALMMIDAAIAIAKRRKVAYQQLMRQVNDDKIPVSAKVPMIEITIDEAAEAVSIRAQSEYAGKLANKIDELMSIARAARVQVIITALRAESSTIPPSIKHHAGTKIALRPEDEGEVANLLGWGLRGLLQDVSAPGMALIRDEGCPSPEPMRTYLIKPEQIEAIAVATASRQPDLDAPSRDAAGDAYARRWDRYRAWLAAQGEHAPVGDDADGDPSTVETGLRGVPMDQQEPGGLEGAMRGLSDANDAMAQARERIKREREAKDGQGDDDAAIAAMAASLSAETDPMEWVVTLLREAGADGLQVDGDDGLRDRLEKAGHPVPRTNLYRWLQNNPSKFRQPVRGRWTLAPGA